MNKSAQRLGRLGKNKLKTISEADRKRRSEAMKAINLARVTRVSPK